MELVKILGKPDLIFGKTKSPDIELGEYIINNNVKAIVSEYETIAII